MLWPDQNIRTALVNQFKGAVLLLDSYSVDASHGLYARNCRFEKGLSGLNQVSARRGVAVVSGLITGDVAANTLAGWMFVAAGIQKSLCCYNSPVNGIEAFDIGANTLLSTLMAHTGSGGASMSSASTRLYAAWYDTTGRIGSGGGKVYGWQIGADPLFAAPLAVSGGNYAVVPTPGGAGLVTPGAHRIAYVTTTRNGFAGPLQPVLRIGGVDVVDPAGFSGGTPQAITLTITFPSLPAYLSGGVSSVQIVMTTTADLNTYYGVPGANFVPVVGANTVTINISDDDLVATGTDFTSNAGLLACRSDTGAPPFAPSAIFQYSARMGYVTIDAAGFPTVYLSDQNKFQQLNDALNRLPLDASVQPVQGVSMHGVLYVASASGFYASADNNGAPVTWVPAQRVDGSVGVLSPTCLLENPISGYIAVASDSGLYIFQGGSFPELPISYYQKPDWDRINWSSPSLVHVQENTLYKEFLVLAPLKATVANVTNTNPVVVTTEEPHLFQPGLSVTLSGVLGTTSANTTQVVTVVDSLNFSIPVAGNGAYTGGGIASPNAANAEMSWSYTEGYTPETVKYSIRAFSAYRPGCFGSIFNLSNSLYETWYGPAAVPGTLIRQVNPPDVNSYRDVDLIGNPVAIDSLFQTSLLPGSRDASGATVKDFHGAHFRVSGNGNLNLRALGLDGVIVTVPLRSPIVLVEKQGREELVKWFLRSEQQTIEVGTNAIDHYFVLAAIQAYYTGAMSQR